MITEKSDIKNWWADSPMTYGLTHGETNYEDASIEFGSKDFFAAADAKFFEWNAPLHGEKPFNKIFPYEKYKGKKVLEIGCGMGGMAMQWAKAGALLTAVDLNPTSITQTKRRFELHNLEGNVFEADGNKLPFEDGEFDYVYSWGVLHHSPDLKRSLDEMMRVLKPGGEFGLMLYRRKSFLQKYMIDYLEGFLHYEQNFLGPLDLASRYTDGGDEEGNPYTWPVTEAETYSNLKPYATNIEFSILGTDLEASLPRILPLIGRYVPTVIKKSWARRYGWSQWTSGTRK
ncbi:class I SAM-dependent methyltransferase [Curvivirga sp.]|uniref:class I SAM-dependent methyltransferase n=1 Tax=Curvivirga sp. TaxID=2856848 RepID=UPI003B5A8B28